MLRRMRPSRSTKTDDAESIDATSLERDVQSVHSGESGSVYDSSRRSVGSRGGPRRGILKNADEATASTMYSSDSASTSRPMNRGRRRRARSVPRRNRDFRTSAGSRGGSSSVTSAPVIADRRGSNESRQNRVSEDRRFSGDGRRFSGDSRRSSPGESHRPSGGDHRRIYETDSRGLPATEFRGRRSEFDIMGQRPRRSRSLQADQPRLRRAPVPPPREEQRHRIIVTPDGSTQVFPEAVLVRGPASMNTGETSMIRNNNNIATVSPIDCAGFGQQTSVRSFDSRNTEGGVSSLASFRSRETLDDASYTIEKPIVLSPTRPPALLDEDELREAWSTFEDVSAVARLVTPYEPPSSERQVADVAGCTLSESRRALSESGGDANLAVLSLLSSRTPKFSEVTLGGPDTSILDIPADLCPPTMSRSESAELAEMGGISVNEARSRLFDTGGDLTAAKAKLMGAMFTDAVG